MRPILYNNVTSACWHGSLLPSPHLGSRNYRPIFVNPVFYLVFMKVVYWGYNGNMNIWPRYFIQGTMMGNHKKEIN